MKTSTKENIVEFLGVLFIATILILVGYMFVSDIKEARLQKRTMLNIGKPISVQYLQGNGFGGCSKTIVTTDKGTYAIGKIMSVEKDKDVMVSEFDLMK